MYKGILKKEIADDEEQFHRQIHKCQPHASLCKQKTTLDPHYFAKYCFNTRAGTPDNQESSFFKKPFFNKEIACNYEEQIHQSLVLVH